HFEELCSGVRGGETDLDAEHIQFLCKPNSLLDGVLRLNWQAKNKGSVNHHAGLLTSFGETPHFLEGHALLDVFKDLFIAAFITDQEKPQPGIFEGFNRVVIEI